MLKVISTSKNGLSREVVHLLKDQGLRTRRNPEDVRAGIKLCRARFASTTRHQWRVNGKWQEINFDFKGEF